VIHGSDVPERPGEPLRGAYLCERPGEVIPVTTVADTVIDLAESCTNVDDVYGWVARAFGRQEVAADLLDLLVSVQLRKRLRWRTELPEAIVAAAGGAHSVLEILWDKNVEIPHRLPSSRKQVLFANGGRTGRRDREYVPYGLIIELDGWKPHSGEQAGKDKARDRAALLSNKETMRFGWRETRYEGCQSAAEVIGVLWRRGWRGRPRACSSGCPVAALLGDLDRWLTANPAQAQDWARRQAAQEAARQAEAGRQAASWAQIHKQVDDIVRDRCAMRASRG
jgi:hypothetical protein